MAQTGVDWRKRALVEEKNVKVFICARLRQSNTLPGVAWRGLAHDWRGLAHTWRGLAHAWRCLAWPGADWKSE